MFVQYKADIISIESKEHNITDIQNGCMSLKEDRLKQRNKSMDVNSCSIMGLFPTF